MALHEGTVHNQLPLPGSGGRHRRAPAVGWFGSAANVGDLYNLVCTAYEPAIISIYSPKWIVYQLLMSVINQLAIKILLGHITRHQEHSFNAFDLLNYEHLRAETLSNSAPVSHPGGPLSIFYKISLFCNITEEI